MHDFMQNDRRKSINKMVAGTGFLTAHGRPLQLQIWEAGVSQPCSLHDCSHNSSNMTDYVISNFIQSIKIDENF
jgi:hypothetical protein